MDIANKKSRTVLISMALLALIVGLGTGLVALAASLGVVAGLWEYRTGFQILRTIIPYSGYIAVGCLILAVFVGVLGQKWNVRGVAKLVGLAAVGMVSASIAWYIPNSYQAPEGQSWPSIHDISTDTNNPPDFVAVLPLRADAPNTAVYGESSEMTPEKLARLQREAYPDIKPVVLDVTADAAFDRALAAVELLGWELVEADRQAGRIEATDTTFWFRFKDDIVIRIRAEASGTRVDARSVSRVGRGDAGTNAKRLRRFFEVL
ncbi:MAG: DUF1499 domain-containing protein [Gammaproteobacteria bacterium]